MEPLGFVWFNLSLDFHCVGNPLESEVVDLPASKARQSLHASFVKGLLVLTLFASWFMCSS